MEAPIPLEDVRARLAGVTIRDRARIRRLLDRSAAGGDPSRLVTLVVEAEERRARRAATVPAVRYPAELPVSERRADIMSAIRDHQVVVVAGETGSGKTTQLPKMCLEMGRGVDGMIGHTQPRRIAARTVAERLADELDVPLGRAVGYAVRFTDTVGEDTLVKVMTDGILLAEIRRDRMLHSYDTIIVDEAHERSLNIDFLLGYLTTLLPRRPDLKVVITSATIDTDRFAEHFHAPVVEVSGRTWPVELRYRPLGADPDDGEGADGEGDDEGQPNRTIPAKRGRDPEETDINAALCAAVREVVAEGPGDVLVFLPGERDIRDAADALRTAGPEGIDILPLYARLSAAEQHRVFRPHRGRRVVLATNVAETSLTVPGIRFVVDTGLARISRFSHRTKVQRLPIERISQASASQRSGRCGRLGPGICIRLYSEDDYLARPEFTDPEILRTNLASVILQMAAIGLGQIEDFPFLEPPDRRSIADGRTLLEELGAIEQKDGLRLTNTGRRLAELPLDPRIGRMVLEAERLDCLREVTVIAAALSIQDPRERPSERSQEAAEMHRRFEVPDSDFMSYVALWEYLSGLQSELSGNQFRRRCRAEFLHVLRIREWQDVAGQIRQALRSRGVHANREPAQPERVHQALLAGLLSHIGLRDRVKGDYLGARNSRWQLGRGSVLSRRPPAWAMAGELVETERTWARTAARIEPSWAERAGSHLVKRSWSDPWWDAKRGEAMTEERATLYGLPVVGARNVALARTDPLEARRIFIERALVERDWPATVPPLERTEERIAAVRALEEKVRRRDLLAGEDVLRDFYSERLPSEVTSGARFERWWRRVGHRTPERFEVPLVVLLDRRGGPVDLAAYPDEWVAGNLRLRLRYRFEPGSDEDGVTVQIPIAALNRVETQRFDWNVPGYRLELVTALVRSLPKPIRRALGPAPETASAALDGCGPHDGPLLDVIAARLARMSGEPVSPGSWDRSVLAPHLNMAFEITDDGRLLGRSRDLAQLIRDHRAGMRAALQKAAPELVRHGRTRWDFGDIPPVLERGVVRAYPALVDEGSSVGVALFESPQAQSDSMWRATRRLLLLHSKLPEAHLQRRLSNQTKLAVARSGLGLGQLLDDCATAVVEQVIVSHGGPSFSAAGFEAMAAALGQDLPDRISRVATIAGGVVAAAELVLSAADRLEAKYPAGSVQSALADVRRQIEGLVHPGFVTECGIGRLRDLLRYLDGAGRRLERLPGDARRDAARQAAVGGLQQRYEALLDRAATAGPPSGTGAALAEVRWMIEELRVSLWAQQLGTAFPVSEERVSRALARLGG